jgi:hypothetical protein
VSSFAEIWEKFQARPVATVVSLLAVFLFLHFPALLIEHAVTGWINEQIAYSLNISSPSLSRVFYHATQPPVATAEQIQRQTVNKERSFVPWFMGVMALAIFSIGELVIDQRPAATIQSDPRTDDILRRLTAVEDLSSSFSRNDYAQRLATLQQNQEIQFSQIKNLMRLAYLERCIERIAEAESNFDLAIKGVKTQIMTPQFGLGMHFSPQAQWISRLEQIEMVAKLCPHNAQDNLRAEPKPEQMDTKTPDEPTGADFDQLRQIRRLYYQSANATALLGDLKRTIIQEMTSIRDQVIQEGQR